MNRRGFLGLFGAAAAGAVLDPERLLWVPGARMIFLPPVVAAPAMPPLVFHPDSFAFAMEALAGHIDRQILSMYMRTIGDFPAGSTIAIRKPARYER